MKNSNFYDNLSSDYDQMIKFENSLSNKFKYFKYFIDPDYKTALDLGCGTAADSIALSQLGLNVDAVDHSEGMLAIAKNNAKRFGFEIKFYKSNLADFEIRNNYDFIVSLGNTLANINQFELESLFKKFTMLLNSDGQILIQMINYAKFPETGKFILNESKDKFTTTIRKYIIHKTHIDFIIDRMENESNNQSQIITKLYPHSLDIMTQLASENGFQIKSFGNLKKEPYVKDKSDNLIILLKK